jgi:hypothetical protein
MSARHQAPEALIVDRQDPPRWRRLAPRDPRYTPGTRSLWLDPGRGTSRHHGDHAGAPAGCWETSDLAGRVVVA